MLVCYLFEVFVVRATTRLRIIARSCMTDHTGSHVTYLMLILVWRCETDWKWFISGSQPRGQAGNCSPWNVQKHA